MPIEQPQRLVGDPIHQHKRRTDALTLSIGADGRGIVGSIVADDDQLVRLAESLGEPCEAIDQARYVLPVILTADVQDERRPDSEQRNASRAEAGIGRVGSGVKKSGLLAVPMVTTWCGGRPNSRRQSERVHSEIVRIAS